MMEPVGIEEIHSPQDKTQPSDSVTQECEHKWHRLKLIQNQIADVSVTMAGDLHGNVLSQTDTLSLLREHKKRLEAELTSLKETGLQTLPDNEDMQRLIFHQDREEHRQQLRETLAFVRAKRKELTESITKEQDIGKQLKELNAVLKEKVSKVDERIPSEEDSASTEHVLADLREERDKMSTLDKAYKKTLMKLLNKHFPVPSENDLKHSKNALNTSLCHDVNNLCPLSSIIGKLVEQTLNSPADPYIDLDESMWPQHIEFLLRSQIVRKDPKNSMKIKLVPFHL